MCIHCTCICTSMLAFCEHIETAILVASLMVAVVKNHKIAFLYFTFNWLVARL